MNRNLWKPLLVGSCLLVLAVHGGPLQRGDVANDPFWFLHVDVDAFKQTTFGKYALAEVAKPEAQQKIAAFQAMFQFDPSKDIHGLTLCGNGETPQDALLIVYADFDAAHLVTIAGGAKEYKSSEHGTHTIHSWLDDKKPDEPRVYAAIVGNRVLFGQKERRVADGLDVLDKTKANLTASTQYSQLADVSGASIIGAARKIDLPASDANSEVFKHSKMFMLNLGEADGKINGNIKMDVDSEEMAQQIQSIGQGLVSLMALQKDKPESTRLSQALSVKQEGATITVKLSIAADDVVGMAKAKAAKAAAPAN
jgi:hypothetical protein